METKQIKHAAHLELLVIGKLDGYWADQLAEQVASLIREGNHRILLNAAELSFMSSAGIRVLLRTSRQLKGIGGAFAVTQPSPFVREVITLSHLHFLFDDARHFGESAPGPAPASTAGATTVSATPTRDIEVPGATGRLFTLSAAGTMTLEAIGPASPFGAAASTTERFSPKQIAWGIGAFGDSHDSCRDSFGEFLAIAGGAATLPTDGSNRPDFLLNTRDFTGSVQVLSALRCTGDFSHQIAFDRRGDQSIPIAHLARAALDATGQNAAVVAIIGEADGLVGAMTRRSPALATTAQEALAFPEVRKWMGFTTERAFVGESAILVGVVAREPLGPLTPHLRPLGNGLHAHLHAAAFGFRPLPRGLVDLAQQARLLFEEQPLRGVLHLIQDERPIIGAGTSEMVRGALWAAPIVFKEAVA